MIGVYFLKQDDNIVYVGQSRDMEKRIGQHKNKTFNDVSFLECEPNVLYEMESNYIIQHQPMYNKYGLIKRTIAQKTLAVTASKTFHTEVSKFCKGHNISVSSFMKKAIKESMIKVRIEEGL